MSGFAVGRIVPSNRSLHACLALRRKSLVLVPHITATTAELAAAEAATLDALDVRAFALSQRGDAMRAVATVTRSVPSLLLAACTSTEECQRARYDGADGVCVAAADQATWTTLAKAAQSLHMLALARVTTADAAADAASWGARAMVMVASEDEVTRASARLGNIVLVAVIADADAATLRRLRGVVDAAVVRPAAFAAGAFGELLDALDG